MNITSTAFTLSVTLLLGISTARVAPAAHMIKTVTETQKLTDPDGGSDGSFGEAVAISGNLAIVGNYTDPIKGSFSGSASIFAFDGTSWNLQAKLTASDEGPDLEFGAAVAISGNMALIGAPADSTLGLDSGAVYVFVFDGTTWIERAKLFFTGEGGDLSNFGESIALSGNTAVIGAPGFHDPGAVYVFTFDGTAWMERAKVTPSDSMDLDSFGKALALSGNRLVVSGEGDSVGGEAYIFTFDGTTWSEEAKLTGLDTVEGDDFGSAVALFGDRALIGAPGKGEGRGAAYIFTFDGTSWNQEAKLKLPRPQIYQDLGYSVALNATVAIVGAPNFSEPGAIYQYSLRRNIWVLRAQYIASDGVEGNTLGISVALSGNTILGGANDSFNSSGAGAAYIFELTR